MKNRLYFLLVFYFPIYSLAQPNNAKEELRPDYRILFYNVENLFDTKDDSLTNDADFLPQGKKYWTGKSIEINALKLPK